jgi:hypothetical protein
LVEVTGRNGQSIGRYHVALPQKPEAVAAVRRRVPDAVDATVEAVSVLSRHAVYNQLRLKRGDIVPARAGEE